MSTLTLELDSYDARFILEALRDLSDKWHHGNQTTADEDQQAEYGNDVMFLDSRRERIERLAVEAFGPQIAQPTHEAAITAANTASSFPSLQRAAPVPESIAASLARSEAQIEVGRTVPLEPALDRLRSSIARMQADEKLKTPASDA